VKIVRFINANSFFFVWGYKVSVISYIQQYLKGRSNVPNPSNIKSKVLGITGSRDNPPEFEDYVRKEFGFVSISGVGGHCVKKHGDAIYVIFNPVPGVEQDKISRLENIARHYLLYMDFEMVPYKELVEQGLINKRIDFTDKMFQVFKFSYEKEIMQSIS